MALYKFLLIFLIANLIDTGLAYRINITKVENCPHIQKEYPVELLKANFIWNGDCVDALHGTYIVRNNDDADRDVIVKLFKCPKKTENECNDNLEERQYSFTCERYLKDLGPWSLLTDSISEEHCTHSLGTFELAHAKFDPSMLEGHVTVEPTYTNYRMLLEFWSRKDDKPVHPDNVENLRSCVVISFDAIF